MDPGMGLATAPDMEVAKGDHVQHIVGLQSRYLSSHPPYNTFAVHVAAYCIVPLNEKAIVQIVIIIPYTMGFVMHAYEYKYCMY